MRGNPHGNPGNNGGWSYTKEFREQQIRLKEKIIAYALEVMETGTEKQKMEMVKRFGPLSLPREVELSGGGEGTNPVQIIVKSL
jgi:hypothetical protein